MNTSDAMNTSDVLLLAKQKLEKYGGWTQGSYAKKRGSTLLRQPTDVDVDCFCALGAIRSIHHYYLTDAVIELANAVVQVDTSTVAECSRDPSTAIVMFNDSPFTNKRKVLQAYDLAIRAALDKESNELCP